MFDNVGSVQMRLRNGVDVMLSSSSNDRVNSSSTSTNLDPNNNSTTTIPTNTNGFRTSTSNPTSRSLSSIDRILSLPGTISRSFQYLAELCCALWVDTTEILAASHLSTSIIQRVSILLILIDFLVRIFQEYIETILDIYSFSNRNGRVACVGADLADCPVDIQQVIWWLAPVFTAISSYSFFLSLLVQLQPTNDVVILTAVLSLGLLECLIVPAALTGCTLLFWFDIFSAETALLVLFVIWAAVSVSSRSIRCVIYPSLGHG